MRRSIQINLDTGKKSVSRPIPSWLGHQRKTSIFVSLGVRDPSDSDSLRALDRCRGERRREHARHYGSLAPSSLGDYLCSSDQTLESESKEKLRFLNFFLHFPWTLCPFDLGCLSFRGDIPLGCSITGTGQEA